MFDNSAVFNTLKYSTFGFVTQTKGSHRKVEKPKDSRLLHPECSEDAKKSLNISNLLSYHWLRYLTDLELECGNIEMGQYKLTAT